MSLLSARFPALAAAAILAWLAWRLVPPTQAEITASRIAVAHDPAGRKVTVTLDGRVFTELRYNTFAKPILWPVVGPGDRRLTRDWPMKSDTPGEDEDHPHHKSLWFTHGDVNGIDFWKEGDDAGKIVTTEVTRAEVAPDGHARLEFKNEWRAPDGRVVCTDTTTVNASVIGSARVIDFTITLAATHGEVVLGDTKEGTMAIRTRPELNVDRKNPLAAGTARNREGANGTAIWGQRSSWVDYQAPFEGAVAGIAVFDHPSNLRHPTTWHARDYGLVAANPFGWHDFSKTQPKGAGRHAIPAGGSQTFRYGFYLYQGAATAAEIDAAWTAWAAR